ncbi:hypothetical protein E3T54_04385 [Cryobacterium sp. Sr8]|uniref:hypothetical protein n=1 Tax=Cryobacterium sp. Sr8 TaxID=1259203 RepID=UPI00106B75E5|nr:hypothetical protein [Cryobacterium sp. Sr8]TFD79902.1 hypothetical protein E3T54_04385 [Cryobacterium sp. Sr8]
MIRRAIETVATSQADDGAFRALADIARLTEGIDDARVVGGHMVGLLLTAYPTPDTVLRRTADADAAVSTQVAESGRLHDLLVDAGYAATAGNRYVKEPGLAVDLLVPADDTTFEPKQLGHRQFDSAPGLRLALIAAPITLDVGVTLLNGKRITFTVRVPPVEIATILKAYAYASRLAAKDVTDLYNLLMIARAYKAEDIGGWRLGDNPLTGARLDTARTLHQLARLAGRSAPVSEAGIPSERFVALVRTLVTSPE